MAATGKTPILLYGSTTATNTPVAGNLTNSSDGCEIAINVADKNLFFKDSTNAVNTVPIRQSSGSSDGWLSSANWTTFNSKQTAYTNLTTIGSLANATGWLYNNGSGTFSYSTPSASDVGAVPTSRTVSTTSPLAGGGALSSNLTLSITQATTSTSGYLSSTDWNTFNNKQPAGTYVTSVTGTAPVVSSGGTTPAISMAAATGSVNGYLTSTDWTTFNNKVSSQWTTSGTAIYYTTGNINVGYAGDVGYKISAYGSSPIICALDNSGNGTRALMGATNTGVYFGNTYSSSNVPIYFTVAGIPGVERAQIDTSGNFKCTSGNFVVGTSGKGIDFSVTSQAAGMTSELLADYEEGTWTPSVVAGTGTITTVGTVVGRYTKIGRIVTVYASIAITTNGTGANSINITGLPYSASTDVAAYCGSGFNGTTAKMIAVPLYSSNNTIYARYYDVTYPVASGETIYVSVSYQT